MSDCPGTESEQAGKSASCQGCPNQQICASNQNKGPDPDVLLIRQKLACVKHIILIMSGKGGVGKSTVTGTLAHALAMDQEKTVGILDVDLCGPSIPKVMGLEGEQVHQSGSGWSPVYVEENLSVMSIGFLLGNLDDAVIWRGPKKNGLIKQFLRDVDWGDLDYLLVDTPPGTSDEHLSIVQYLKSCHLAGAVIVTTPQEVSLLDVRKEINFCKKVNIPVLGIIENMSHFVCPKCKNQFKIFPPTTGGSDSLSKEMNVPVLGKVPLDPVVGKYCDEGKSFIQDLPNSSVSVAYQDIVKGLLKHIETMN